MAKKKCTNKNSIRLALCTLAILVLGPFLTIGQAGQKDKGPPDVRRIEGRWLRPDGGYVLEVRAIKKDNTVEAAYFNPRPISVHEAHYQIKQGKINLFVELRDVNYPGSKYHLEYDPQSDRLVGFYFQAVQRQTFDVEFVRVK
jgi:hypothetical protein